MPAAHTHTHTVHRTYVKRRMNKKSKGKTVFQEKRETEGGGGCQPKIK